MNFAHSQRPSPALQPFIERFSVMKFERPLRDSHLPGTGAVAAFALGGECVIDDSYVAPSAAFTGMHNALRRHEHRDGHAVLLVTFTSVGAAAFSTVPLREVTAGTVSLEHVVGAHTNLPLLQHDLRTASTHQARVALAERFFRANLRHAQPDVLVQAAVQWIMQRHGQSRVRDLVQHIGLSQSALERRFHNTIGTTPKKFAMLVRLQRAVRLMKAGDSPGTIAHDAGYFDHSHFINDFQRVAGETPDRYFESLRRRA